MHRIRIYNWAMWAKPSAWLTAVSVFSVLAPSLCFAAVSAGFPAQPLWLSEDSVMAGDSVGIFTVLYNESTTSIRGSVIFSVDSTQVGTVDFTVDPGKNEVLSTNWDATAGTHSVAAAIAQATDANAQNVSLASGEAATLKVDVASPPPPSQAEQNAAAVSGVVNSFVASSTPALSNAAQGAFALTEQVRQGAINYLESQLSALGTTSSPDSQGQVLGVSTYRAPVDTSAPAAPSWWTMFVREFYTVALMVARSVALFYPLLAVIIFGAFYMLIRTVRRPHSRY